MGEHAWVGVHGWACMGAWVSMHGCMVEHAWVGVHGCMGERAWLRALHPFAAHALQPSSACALHPFRAHTPQPPSVAQSAFHADYMDGPTKRGNTAKVWIPHSISPTYIS
eukprot:366571-Chlamydomonas_euryale.AAC.12